MVSGGARARSGPAYDPNSARSDRLGRSSGGTFALDANGYRYRPPRFPLGTYLLEDEVATERWHERELEVWKGLWRLPQAIAWHDPCYAYLQGTVALYARQYVICESSSSTASDRATLARYADTIGLTPQGLKLNGWKIVPHEVKTRKKTKPARNVIAFPSARERYEEMG